MDGKKRWLAAREQVSEALATNMQLYGVNHSTGRLYSTLFFHHHPMTLEDMMQDLGMSKTSMSTGVRTLLDAHMVNKVWKKGVRKDLYEVAMDWYQTFVDYFRSNWRKAIEMNMESMKKCIKIINEVEDSEEMAEEDRELMQLDRQRLQEALLFYQWLNRFVDSLETGEIFTYIPKE